MIEQQIAGRGANSQLKRAIVVQDAGMDHAPDVTGRREVSPVTRLSSTSDRPDKTTPSAGARSLGRTNTTSPGPNSVAGIEVASPNSSMRVAIGARNAARLAATSEFSAASRVRNSGRSAGRRSALSPIEIGVRRMICGLDQRHPERERQTDRNRHVHVERASAQSLNALRKNGWPANAAAGRTISAESQWKKSRVSGVMSLASPAQIETESSITFIAAKPATARQRNNHRACRASESWTSLAKKGERDSR